MAVVRFKLPAMYLRVMSRMMKGQGHVHAARELERAAARPGLMAELGADEFFALHELAPWPADVADTLDTAKTALEGSLAREATRLRGPALGMAPHRSYHARLINQKRPKDDS